MTHPVTHTSGGWHHQVVDAHSAATSVTRQHMVTWRTQRRLCCGQEHTIADEREAPVWIDGSYGDVAGRVTQCGTCGLVYAARYSARRVYGEDDR